jgi:AbrB family looped-hinge helix DNA binding protein
MRLTSKGQVTIPQEIRDRLGLLPNTTVVFDVVGDAVRIRKAPDTRSRGDALLQRMRRAGAAQTRRMTTDQILALTRE